MMFEALGIALAVLAAQTTAAWQDPSPHRVRSITVDRSVHLEVLDWGGTGQPIVLLACYLTAHVYDDFAPKLAPFHVYGITRRGIGASDQPTDGYDLQRSSDDVLEVLDALQVHKPILVANSCGGWVQTRLAAQHPDRLGGLVYLEAADDPTLTLADYHLPPVDTAHLPKSAKPAPPPDYTSFEAYRRTQRRDHGVAFPEAELRQLFAVRTDGSLGESLLSPRVRDAITRDARAKPDYARVRVPVLAIFRTPRPFEIEAKDFVINSDEERAALRQQYDAGKLMIARWENDLRAGVPSARIVELPGANLYMFLSNEADVLREIRAFAAARSK
jgi:pimeloyl-ACP methyl ester carboxylesterase